jgi:hypothetical protein
MDNQARMQPLQQEAQRLLCHSLPWQTHGAGELWCIWLWEGGNRVKYTFVLSSLPLGEVGGLSKVRVGKFFCK